MASTFSDLGIELMATGENAGTWGDKTNTNLQIVEKAIAGYVEKSIAGGAATTALSITDGDTTESTSVARHAVIKLTGTITGNQIVTVPDSIEKVYIIVNGTSGEYSVQFKTASGTGVTFGASDKGTKLVFSDGTNIVDTSTGNVGTYDLNGESLILDADADTTITADTDDQIDIAIAGADDFRFTANTFTALSGSSVVIPDGGLTLGSTAVTSTAAELNILDGVTSTAAELNILDGVTSTAAELNILDGVTSTTAELNILDGVTSTAAELNIVDGNTSATSTTLADADRVVVNDNGTMVQVALTDFETYFESALDTLSNVTTVGALNSGSITSGFGTIDTGSSTITTTGLITGGSLDIDDVLINGSNIGHTDDTDLLTVASGVLTVAGEVSMTTLDIGGTNVTSTAAELNLLDGKDATHLAVPGKFSGTNFTNSILIGHATTGTLNDAQQNIGVGVGTLDSITSADGNIAIGHNALTALTTGAGSFSGQNIAIGIEAADGITNGYENTVVGSRAGRSWTGNETQNTVVGHNAMSEAAGGDYNSVIGRNAGKVITGQYNIAWGYNSADALTSGSGNVIIGNNVDADSATGDRQLKIAGNDGSTTTTWISGDNSGNLTFGANATVTGDLIVNGTTTTVNSTTVTVDDPIFTLGGDSAPGSDDNKDRGIEFRYHNGSAAKVGFFGFDDSTSKFTFIADATNSSEVFSGSAGDVAFGEVVATSLDISGNADIDGTTNLDVVDIDGAVDMASTLQVDGAITSSSGATITVSDNTAALELISTDADANVGPRLSLYRNSASPADNDILGDIRFMGEDDASAKLEYAKIEAQALDVSDGSIDTQLRFQIRHAGSGNDILKLTPTEVAFNDGSFDTDFRVESNNQANAFKIDAGNDTASFAVPVDIDSGITIDNITIDGTEIDLSSGDLTVDVAGDITLDAGGSDIRFDAGGTEYGKLNLSGNNLNIHSSINNADIVFKGVDNSSDITALTLDMSDAGTAIFNHDIVIADDGRIGSASDTDAIVISSTGIATFNGSANVAQQALTSSSNAVAWDASTKPNAFHLTTENTTFSAPSNAIEGAFIALEINYNGSHTIAFNTVFEFAGSTAPTFTSTDGKTDILVFRYNGSVWQEVGRTLNLSES